MPKVGTKTFPYTDKGEGQAEIYAAQTGQPISREEKDSFGYGTYQEGGGVEEQKPDLQGYLNSDDHKEWLNSPWDSENDIHMLKTIIGAMHMHGDYGEKNNQKYLEDYATMLEQVSNKKGAPPAKELHDTLREMQYGKQRGGSVKDQFGYGSYQEGGGVKPGIFDFAWNKYEQGDDTYKRAQQDLYLQDKKYWDSKKAHREYLDAIKNDAEQSPEFMVMDVILKGLSSKIANSLDNTEQPLTMAKDLLRFTEGDANKAAEMAAQINYEFSSTAPENSAVGDYWDYWTRKLPEIYKTNEMQRGGPVKRYGY